MSRPEVVIVNALSTYLDTLFFFVICSPFGIKKYLRSLKALTFVEEF
jgi:membrane protein required for beta-lactamase induction